MRKVDFQQDAGSGEEAGKKGQGKPQRG